MPGKTRRFRSGDVVEVRSADEILSTLDASGMFEGVPFMEEMRRFCGKRFRVFKRADKVCVESPYFLDLRRMRNAVLLEEVRCDGSAHDGCGRLCMIFWKEAWLKPAGAGARAEPPVDWVSELSRRAASAGTIDETKIYECQSTALHAATEHLRIWDVRHYVRDFRSGALPAPELARVVFGVLYRTVAGVFGFRDVGKVVGTAKKTPSVKLGLCPGELVRIKRKEEVALTLDEHGKNRGLGFGEAEISRHCGQSFRVLGPIDRMILEDSGKMRKIDSTVLLQGTACSGVTFRGCARNSHPMWREAWLERAGPEKNHEENRSGSLGGSRSVRDVD
jgi:hypothetical protein